MPHIENRATIAGRVVYLDHDGLINASLEPPFGSTSEVPLPAGVENAMRGPGECGLRRRELVGLSQNHLLQAGNAVAAILVDQKGHYLLQLRDERPDIWYPGHWGFFGGSVDMGEDESEALRRELREELELQFTRSLLFTRFDFDLRPLGLNRYFRAYYEIRISAGELAQLSLHEGAEMRSVPGDEALTMKLVPYDGFALFLHHHRSRLIQQTSA